MFPRNANEQNRQCWFKILDTTTSKTKYFEFKMYLIVRKLIKQDE